jgi:TonB-linked SusC/RagA family outer membrane protein
MYKIYTSKSGMLKEHIHKIMLIMRLTTFLLFLSFLQASATSFAQRITLNEKNVTLETIFKAVRAQSGYDFLYDRKIISQTNPVNINVKNASVEDVLEKCFVNQSLNFTIQENTVVITERTKSMAERITGLFSQYEIKGVITDNNGKPLPGASVKIKGTNTAVITDGNGEFKFNITDNAAVLVITYVGYQTREVNTADRSGLISIILQEDENKLNEVTINTGYQVISKERSTGSFSSPDVKVMASRSTSMNILDRLDGLVPGLSMSNGTNKNFYPVMLRGLTSINGATQPLYVVDGIPVDNFDQINPNDVENITVLKDATASSIWGARASNGVIVVTTKTGKKNKNGIEVNYDFFYSFRGKPEIDVFPRLKSSEYIQTVQELYNMPGYIRAGATDWATINVADVTSGKNFILPHEYLLYGQQNSIPSSYKSSSLQDLAVFNNVQQIKDQWYRNAALENHTASISGSSDKYAVYASFGYTNDQSPTPGEKDKNYQLNARQDYKFNKWLDMFLTTNLTYNNTYAKRAIAPDNRFVPYASFVDEQGNGHDISWINMSNALRTSYENKSIGLPNIGKLNLSYNPQNDFDSGFTKGTSYNTRLLTGVTAKLLKGLRFEGTYGAVLNNTQTEIYDDASGYLGQIEIAKMTVTTPALKSFVPTTGGNYANVNGQRRNWTIRNQFAYDNNWDNYKHQLTAIAGIEIQKQTFSQAQTRLRGYDLDILSYKPIDYNTTSLGLANTIINTNGTYRVNDIFAQSYLDTRFRSYYMNGAYTYSGKYTINASTRYDQSNLFGADVAAQAKPVWSVGGSWLLSGESFMEQFKWVNRLAVRTTYGITGNSPIPGSGGSYDILGAGFALGAPAGLVTPLKIITPGNSKLTWEQTQNFNAGIDISVLDNRLSGSIDIYHKHTTNLLGFVPQNAFTGYASVYGNAGTINNKGVEITLNSVNIRSDNFSWSSQLNFAFNKGKVVSLNSEYPIVFANTVIKGASEQYYQPQTLGLMTGYQPFSLFAYKYAGLDAVGDPQIHLSNGTITKSPGIAKMEDLVNMGSTNPLVTGGFNNLFQYRQFSLGFNMVFNLGFVLRRDVNEFYTGRIIGNSFITGNIHAEFENRWKKSNDELITNIPAFDPSADRASRTDLNYYAAADINVVKGDYIKMRDITFSYQLPNSILKDLKIKNFSLLAQLNNVMLWRANKYGIDPEFYNGIGNSSAMYVTGLRSVPVNQKTITLGAHLTF